jgi:hypothetical protein
MPLAERLQTKALVSEPPQGFSYEKAISYQQSAFSQEIINLTS